MARFILLIRGGDDAFGQFTPEQMEQALGRYFACRTSCVVRWS